MCQTSVNRDSKPGVPWTKLASDNELFIESHLPLIKRTVIDRLHLFVDTPIEEIRALSPQQLVEQGFCDPVRVFVKGEPHSTRKVEQERWRLISAISLCDQLVERLLCNDQNKLEIAEYETNPSAPGLGLSDDQQLAAFYVRVMRIAGGGEFAEADVTGWDWSVQEWELAEEAEFRIELGSMNPVAAQCMRARFICVANSVYALPDGSLVELLFAGVQLSGCFNTSSTNSRLRVFVAYLAGAMWAIAMGDDCVEDAVEQAREKYSALGHPLKMYVKKQTNFEFCSNIFSSEGAWPVDGTKTLYNLLEQKNITPELIYQFTAEMRNHPRREEYLASARRVMRAGKDSE